MSKEEEIVLVSRNGRRVHPRGAYAEKLKNWRRSRPTTKTTSGSLISVSGSGKHGTISVRDSEIPEPKNGAELVAYWQQSGVIGMRKDINDARVEARRLRDQAEAERQR